jgi:hypothetical protein
MNHRQRIVGHFLVVGNGYSLMAVAACCESIVADQPSVVTADPGSTAAATNGRSVSPWRSGINLEPQASRVAGSNLRAGVGPRRLAYFNRDKRLVVNTSPFASSLASRRPSDKGEFFINGWATTDRAGTRIVNGGTSGLRFEKIVR